MYFHYGIKNSTLEMQEEKPLELKIPEDRVNNLCPPDQMQLQHQEQQQQQQYMTTEMEDPYAQSSWDAPSNDYAQQPAAYGQQPTSNAFFTQVPDPLAEDPWSKYN